MFVQTHGDARLNSAHFTVCKLYFHERMGGIHRKLSVKGGVYTQKWEVIGTTWG